MQAFNLYAFDAYALMTVKPELIDSDWRHRVQFDELIVVGEIAHRDKGSVGSGERFDAFGFVNDARRRSKHQIRLWTTQTKGVGGNTSHLWWFGFIWFGIRNKRHGANPLDGLQAAGGGQNLVTGKDIVDRAGAHIGL